MMVNSYSNTLTSAINSWQQNDNNTANIMTYKIANSTTDSDTNNFKNFEDKIKSLENQIKKLEEKKFFAKVKNGNGIITDFACCAELDLVAPYLTKVEILKPGKVLRFTFSDDTVIKTVCADNDPFDFKFAFFLAYAKYFWENVLTTQGIENKARDFTNVKFFNSLVKKGMKVYFNQKKKEEREEKEEAERKKVRANRIAKKIAKKEKAREDRINEMAEAIRRAKN